MKARVDTQPMAALLAAAAAILSGEAIAAGPPRDFLASLGYLDDPDHEIAHRVALLHAAAGFQRIFSLRADDAPGLVALGAEADPACLGVDGPTGGVSGTGLDFRQAFEACVGEGVEYISQFATPDDGLEFLTADEALRGATPELHALWGRLGPYRRTADTGRTAWVVAANLKDGSPTYLPADLCLRRPPQQRDIDPPWPLSTGCGAGTDPLDATLHGLLELIERDALALWWRGGLRAALLPPGPGGPLLARLRGDVTGRRTWLLDITSDVGVPVVVAAACNDDGFGLCVGHACRPTIAAAADAAVMELAQMELAYRLSATKRTVRGDAALNVADRQHIDRYTAIDVRATPALLPLAPPRAHRDLSSFDRIKLLAAIREHLVTVGVDAYALDLTRSSIGISVTRTLAPGLEPGLSAPPGRRLRDAANRSRVDVNAVQLL